MTEPAAAAFEEHRSHLRQVALRMLGSAAEAEDAVQEAWLKVARADTSLVENMRGWLTTVVSRVCLDLLRSRTSRREDALDAAPELVVGARAMADRELADAVGAAMLIVLDKLDPAERVAFVLKDLFGMPFDEIAAILGRTSAATRQLASRARRRVQGATAPEVDLATQRRTVEAYIAALAAGDVEGLVALLAPDVVVRMDGGDAAEVPDRRAWAEGAVVYRGAAQHMRPVLVDGRVALALAPHGKLARVLVFDFDGGSIRESEIITEAEALADLVIEELP
jgi:RNA polymerase sigma-70 factor (ECF subfamily)